MMNKKVWYFKNNSEVYSVLYEDKTYILVMNDESKLYSFGLKNDFGTLYGFPVNQSCLTKEETIGTLKSFIEIDNKYGDINNTAKVWGNMIKILSE